MLGASLRDQIRNEQLHRRTRVTNIVCIGTTYNEAEMAISGTQLMEPTNVGDPKSWDGDPAWESKVGRPPTR